MKRVMTTCFLAACYSAGCSTSDTATEADYDDVAQSLSAVVSTGSGAGDVAAMSDAATISLGAAAGNDAISLDASGAFIGHHVGLEYKLTASCKDEAGADLAKCSNQTDSSRIGVNWAGELSLPLFSAQVTRSGDWTFTKIQSGTAQIDGLGEFTLDAQVTPLFRGGAQRTYDVTYSAEYEGVLIDVDSRRVSGGKVTFEIDAERRVSSMRRMSEASFEMTGELEFAPNGGARLTLDGKFSYLLDTASGIMVREPRSDR